MFHRARTRAQQRRAEWAAIGLSLLALVAWLSTPGSLARVNHLVQDTGLRLVSRPAQPDIVVVAVDDRSIAAIGRWPWRRALHAQLVQNVSRQEPLAIGMDVLFNEDDLDYPEDDVLLADAVAQSGRVVLPVMQRQGPSDAGDGSDLPMPALEKAAARLGHVHVAPDSDGVVRSLYLREGPADALWPHFSTAMRCVASPSLGGCAPRTQNDAAPDNAPWERTGRTLIPFAGGPGHFTTYSYIDVLRGEIPANALRGKYVLVGSAAAGLGDMFATPVSRESRLMPGVEVVAQVLDAELSGVHIGAAPPALNAVFNLLPVALALLALLLLGPFAALLTSVALAIVTLVLAVVLPLWSGLQFAPAAALIGLVLAYPLWSWRRLSAAAQFLRVQMENLQRQGLVIPLRGPAASSGDFLERRINAVEYASRQLRDMHHFVSESLQQLPSPTLVCDTEGHILLANTAARRHLLGIATEAAGDPMVWPLQGRQITDVLGDLVDTVTDQPLVTPQRLAERTLPARREGRDAKGRSVLVQSRQFTDLAQAGWLVTLVDLTEMRSALQQRDQAMHFISHDIRAPNASILTLLEMHRAYPGRMPDEELMQRIASYAKASLGMAENFVQLAGAESQAMRREPLDLTDVLHQTADEAWALAREGDVQVAVTEAPDAAPFTGDRALLCRALGNVVSNAIKYSPKGGQIQCTLTARPGWWVVAVRDQGPGIAPALQDKLFAPFQRLHDRSHPGIAGVGLGLALVHTVVQRHGGSIEVESDEGQGAEFRLVLPQGERPAD